MEKRIPTLHKQNCGTFPQICRLTLIYCNQYNNLWKYLYENICPKYQQFEILADQEKINIVMSSVCVKQNILQNICIKPTKRDVHLSIICDI